jgi:DNA-binding beta-propeller fold protein YncE
VLDAGSGTIVRTVPVGTLAGAIAVDERTGQAFVSNTLDRTLLVLDGRTASVLRTVAVPWAPGALAVDERRGDLVVAHAYDNGVSLLDAASGRVVRTVAVPWAPRALAVDQRRGRVVVLTSEERVPSAPVGQVQMLDGQTGQLLHTVAVGADARALALDERTGDAFVTAVTAMNGYGMPAGSDKTRLVRAWLRRWLPWFWVSRLLPPVPAPTTGMVTMFDLSRLSA